MQEVGSRRFFAPRRDLAGALMVIGLIAGAVTAGIGQTSNTPDQTTRKVRLRGGDDPNVKSSSAVNVRPKPSDPGIPVSPPTSKPTPCTVNFDNQTDLFTKTYIDGVYAGTIRPFGGLTAPAAAGSTTLYARAEYDDGSADAWGPIRISCKTKYTWRLAD
jgi:hypothetical protein